MTWYACTDCPAATNSPRNAANHQEDTGHTIIEEPQDA